MGALLWGSFAGSSFQEFLRGSFIAEHFLKKGHFGGFLFGGSYETLLYGASSWGFRSFCVWLFCKTSH